MVRPVERLGIYVDGPYEVVEETDGVRVAPDLADLPFLTFATAVGDRFDSTVLFVRARRAPQVGERLLLPEGIGIVELPYYEDLREVRNVARAIPGTVRAFWRGLAYVDAVWVFGPHPLSVVLGGLALLRRKQVVLGVRQDTLAYFHRRLPNARWQPALWAARLLDATFRVLARGTKVTVVGDELARHYGGPSPRLLTIAVSLVRDSDLVSGPAEHDWSGTIHLLTVGRIDQEKNPLLLVEMMAALERERPGRYRLVWAGWGPLGDEVRTRAAELGLEDRIELLGFIPFGKLVLERYRAAHVFVHVSLTEGVPAVLAEALASGTPIVATAVGGVPVALEHGAAGVLVSPDDVDAMVEAIMKVTDDPALRARVVARGLEVASAWTLDAQAVRVQRFIAGVGDVDSAFR
jgi:glycosyltransferase involved in cell wall biosynthesis